MTSRTTHESPQARHEVRASGKDIILARHGSPRLSLVPRFQRPPQKEFSLEKFALVSLGLILCFWTLAALVSIDLAIGFVCGLQLGYTGGKLLQGP